MADLKITALTAATAVADTDLLVIVQDMSTTPITKKITIDTLFDNIRASGFTFGGDTNIYRNGASILKTDDNFVAAGYGAFGDYLLTYSSIKLYTTGATILFGDSADGYDCNIYRYAANIIKTDDAFSATTLYVYSDAAGVAGTVGISNVVNETISTGVGSIKMGGTTARTNTGFLKIYNGTSARYIPYFTDITG
jgi:hypothetical protein